MAIFEKSFQAVVALHSAIKAANEAFHNATKEINATYIDSVANQKIDAARSILSNTYDEQKKIAREAIEADFANVHKQFSSFVAEVVPADFVATLEALKAKGENISDFEYQAFMQKYKGNYTATSALFNVFAQSGKTEGFYVIKPDVLYSGMLDLEGRLQNWIRNYKGADDYMTNLYVSDPHSPILKMGAAIQDFFNGNFLIKKDRKHKML